MDPPSEVKTEMSKIVTVALPQDSISCSWSRSSNLLILATFSYLSCLTDCKNKILNKYLQEERSTNIFIQVPIVFVLLDTCCWNFPLSVCDTVFNLQMEKISFSIRATCLF